MNEIVNKVLLAGDKFMPEMHLKQPGFTYSAYGPFTKNNWTKIFPFTSCDKYLHERSLPFASFDKYLHRRSLRFTSCDKYLHERNLPFTSCDKTSAYERWIIFYSPQKYTNSYN